jgi:hypothetical protein
MIVVKAIFDSRGSARCCGSRAGLQLAGGGTPSRDLKRLFPAALSGASFCRHTCTGL